MVTPTEAEDLLLPLVVRAHAFDAWPQLGFVDQAAQYLVRKLDLDPPDWGRKPQFSAQQQLDVARCKWIDEQVLDFLRIYPDAMGIELGAGLSTRFQRLSGMVDWPRFSWADVDSQDIIDCADLIFPATDNYRLVPCDIVRDDWLKKSGWSEQKPLIVIVEALPDGTHTREIRKILAPLINVIEEKINVIDEKVPVHVILDYANPTLQQIRNRLGSMLFGKSRCGFVDAHDFIRQLALQGRVLNEQDLAANPQGPLMHRLLANLYCRLTGKRFWGAVHLRLDATRS